MFDIWNYQWECCMEGGRIIHPNFPYIWYDDMMVERHPLYPDTAIIRLMQCTRYINYWDGKLYTASMAGGVLRSVQTFGYGTFSAEIKMPQGKGLWGSFWLCGDGPWPQSGEIDICEGYSDNNYFRLTTPYFPWLNPSWKTTNNIHYAENGEHKQVKPHSVSVFKQPCKPTSGYVKYECKWTPSEIVIKVGGKLIRRDKAALKHFTPTNGRMRVIFNLWCEDPENNPVIMQTPMLIKNFNYEPYEHTI